MERATPLLSFTTVAVRVTDVNCYHRVSLGLSRAKASALLFVPGLDFELAKAFEISRIARNEDQAVHLSDRSNEPVHEGRGLTRESETRALEGVPLSCREIVVEN
jgi:hypothetical protein